jgi:hypothetical protein
MHGLKTNGDGLVEEEVTSGDGGEKMEMKVTRRWR